MKTKTALVGIVIALLFVIESRLSFAQTWLRGGNNAVGTPFLGSNSSTNQAIQFGTLGITRQFIQNNSGSTAGFIGMGNGFITPLSLLHINATSNGTGEVFRTDCPNTNTPAALDLFSIN